MIMSVFEVYLLFMLGLINIDTWHDRGAPTILGNVFIAWGALRYYQVVKQLLLSDSKTTRTLAFESKFAKGAAQVYDE